MTFHSSISSPSFSDGNPLSSMIANGARAMSACCTSMGGRATCAFSGQFNAAIPSVTIAIAMLDWQEEDAPRKKASISFFRSFRSVRRDSRSTERLCCAVPRSMSSPLFFLNFVRTTRSLSAHVRHAFIIRPPHMPNAATSARCPLPEVPRHIFCLGAIMTVTLAQTSAQRCTRCNASDPTDACKKS